MKCLEVYEIGKYNKEEIYVIGEKDFCVLLVFLGDKEFFMGLEFIIIDCMVFGLLLCLLYMVENLFLVKVVNEDLKNLVDFCY